MVCLMSYIDGYVIAVPTENKEDFIEHARMMDSILMDFGALRVMECWEDDVRDGKNTDFRRAVNAKNGESIVFSWVVWPDKETRQKADERIHEIAKTDPRFSQEDNPVPFDGARMIFGGFVPVLSLP